MGKKDSSKNNSTIENRVYLFRDLAAAWMTAHGKDLGAAGARGAKARRALADIAYVSCVVADSGRASAEQVAELVAADRAEADSASE